MRNVIRLLTFAAIVATFALPAFAQDAQPAAAQGNVCEEQARTDLYTKYYNSKKTDQKTAFETGKEYLQKYSSCTDQYTAAVKKFVDAYAKGSRQVDFTKLLNEKKFVDAFAVGKQMVADNPDDVQTTVLLAWAGLNAATSGNSSLNADAINYAQKAIQLIQSGKTPESWSPFTGKDDALGWLNYIIGTLNLKTNPTEAANYLIKAAQIESSAKKEPTTYSYLAFAYNAGEYKKLADEYKKLYDDFQTRCVGKPETPECKADSDKLEIANANVNLVLDRIIDAYARAVAYSTAANQQQRKAQWKNDLTELYKSRHNNSDTGLNELITGVTSKPLLQTTPVTTPPAPTTPPAGTSPAGGTTGPTASPTPPPKTTNITAPTTEATGPTTAPKSPAPTTARPKTTKRP